MLVALVGQKYCVVPTGFLILAGDEMGYQERDVLPAVPEGRQKDGEDLHPIKRSSRKD
jgi:hypothetical protein